LLGKRIFRDTKAGEKRFFHAGAGTLLDFRSMGELEVWPDFLDDAPEIVILGITESGDTFRPSDWAERVSGMLSVFSPQGYLAYSPYLKPIISAGIRCVAVDMQLRARDRVAFEYLLQFARDNDLKMRRGRQAKRPEDESLPPGTAAG